LNEQEISANVDAEVFVSKVPAAMPSCSAAVPALFTIMSMVKVLKALRAA
jgi:hypothetical protein